MDNQTIWKIIDAHFDDNERSLVRHHIESFNDFYDTTIFQIFKEKNPVVINSMYDESIDDFRHQCTLYFGGKNGNKIYFGKPVIYDSTSESPHYMFPNESRLRNMSYSMTIHYDIDIEFIDILEKGQPPYTTDIELFGGNAEGGDSTNPYQPDGEQDYTKEHMEAAEMRAGNYKTMKLNDYSEKDLESLDSVTEGGDAAAMVGGGPKATGRQKRFKSVEVAVTPAMAERAREMSEQTMIAPNIQKRTSTIKRVYLGRFPIMVQSKYCVLDGLPREMRYNMGECRNDIGGYFIIDGKEKTVVPQEKFADNMLYIREVNDEHYMYSAEIRSVSENVAKPIRTLSVKMKRASPRFTFENIVVNIPNVRTPIPLFILFRALGVISDKSIITMCLLDLDKYENMVDLFIPSVHDAACITNQQSALMYIASLTKYSTVTYALEILNDYFLPHVGETNYLQKAYYLGYIVFRLLCVYTKLEQPTDRDNFKYKRIELVGSLMTDLFREYYNMQQKEVLLNFKRALFANKSQYEDNLPALIQQNYREVFRERIVEIGFKKAFKGNWGAQTHTKRVGVVQDLNRLSFNTAIAHLRKTNLPLDSSAKLVGPRVLHSSQWGYMDPIDTPDGGNIGLHKSLAIFTYVTRGYSREPMVNWLRINVAMKLVEDCSPLLLSTMTRVFVNGYWSGAVHDPFECLRKFKLFRRNALIPIHTSISFDIKQNTLFIYTDAGRVSRPIFYRNDETSKLSFENKDIIKAIGENEFKWSDLIAGFNKKRVEDFTNIKPAIYNLSELYEGITNESNPARLERFLQYQAIIDYIDPSESENALIAINTQEMEKNTALKYTHLEIHESSLFGVMGNQIVYAENNPPTRNSFSCGQSKQAVSMYHTNFPVRMDKTAVVLNYGQTPIVKSRYYKHINNEENPYGVNAIVAIMCYTGYNVEDAILINEGALKRGLFTTTYYTVYETHEETSMNEATKVDKHLTNIEMEPNVVGKKAGYDYSKLDKYGLIRENTVVDEKTVLIGMTSNNMENPSVRIDMSKTPKKGQLGVVDKTFVTEGEEGTRIAKVRIRDTRIPNLGDKFAARTGQKGTVGMVIPECDMPFTRDGIRPDIIINPHAIPSRMTIGQFVETLAGKMGILYGGYSDCTAFNNNGSKIGLIGEHLTRSGYHSSGNELLYNGMTGEQIESEIFIGPTYYMRLKHMVKDKINYRARGPNTALTKQPVSGRANDGGLRIGEMERDVLISHGISDFLAESMMERGDKYYMAICNQTGMMAVYNPSNNLFMSPMADGPLRYTGSVDGKTMHVEQMSRFGREFSVVCVPYSFKLLLQELQTINISMRIITEDNIRQLENLAFSKNIDKLTKIEGVTPSNIIINTTNILKTHTNIAMTPTSTQSPLYMGPTDDIEIAGDSNPAQPAYNPYSKEYSSQTSPQYEPTSPAYNPTTPEYEPTSPGYNPRTPEYEPSTPDYPPPAQTFVPTSPDYPPPANAIPDLGSEYDEENNEQYMEGGMANDAMKRVSMEEEQAKYRNRAYEIGEMVFYRGGSKPNRPWTIKDIGNEFVTIETHDMEGFNDAGDSIKVVYPMDIYRPEEVVMAPNMMHMNPQMGMYGSQMMGMMGMGGPGGINVNPVIKIVNGPDNSVDNTPESNMNQMMGGPVSMPMPMQMPMSMNNHVASAPIIVKSNSLKEGGAESTNEKEKDIDFNNFVIKKV